MSGSVTNVALRSAFTVADSAKVTQLLREVAKDVKETRKGRYWEFSDSGSHASVTVLETQDRPEFHDELLEAGFTSDDAPEIVLIDYPCKNNREACWEMAQRVAFALDGHISAIPNRSSF